jgi:hypothetical protein
MRFFPGSLSMLTLVFLAACATNVPVDPFGVPKRIWPDAPQTPRIAYLGAFSEAADLGIEGGFWSRIVAFTAGPTNDVMARPMAVAATDDGQLIFVGGRRNTPGLRPAKICPMRSP